MPKKPKGRAEGMYHTKKNRERSDLTSCSDSSLKVKLGGSIQEGVS